MKRPSNQVVDMLAQKTQHIHLQLTSTFSELCTVGLLISATSKPKIEPLGSLKFQFRHGGLGKSRAAASGPASEGRGELRPAMLLGLG